MKSNDLRCRLGVLVSGSGTNLQAILDATQDSSFPAMVAVVISNNPNAYAIQRAQARQVPTFVIPHNQFLERQAFEKEMIDKLDQAGVQLIILAGFMRLLSPFFVNYYSQRILNIHPSLLPAFPGTHAIQDAWNAGAKTTGVTIHVVDEGTDTGPILLQETVPIQKEDSLETLEAKIHEVEHKLYPKAIRLFIEKNINKN